MALTFGTLLSSQRTSTHHHGPLSTRSRATSVRVPGPSREVKLARPGRRRLQRSQEYVTERTRGRCPTVLDPSCGGREHTKRDGAMSNRLVSAQRSTTAGHSVVPGSSSSSATFREQDGSASTTRCSRDARPPWCRPVVDDLRIHHRPHERREPTHLVGNAHQHPVRRAAIIEPGRCMSPFPSVGSKPRTWRSADRPLRSDAAPRAIPVLGVTVDEPWTALGTQLPSPLLVAPVPRAT